MCKINNQLSQEEMEILSNEFIVISRKVTKENLHVEIFKYLRLKNIKIKNPEFFNQLYELIENKYL